MTEFLNTLNESKLAVPVVAALGLMWGSFFNVCIVRIPNEENVVFGGSRCPKCGKDIPWYLNIPLVSYLWLGGKCKQCGTRISIQYPLVEVGTAASYVYWYLTYGFSVDLLMACILTSYLIIISVIDLYHRIIPDGLSLSGAVIGLVASLVWDRVLWWESALGILIGGGLFLLIAWLYEKSTGREGLGGGDIKLLGMLGGWLGIQSVLPIIVMSSAMGSIVGLTLMLFQRKDFRTEIPFGPFLAAAALIELRWGTEIAAQLFPVTP